MGRLAYSIQKKGSMKKLYITILLYSISAMAQENTATISGFVFDEENHEALIGVNVYIEDLLIGASTNNSGYYVITDVPPGSHSLTSSILGYGIGHQDISVMRAENKKVNILLKQQLLETETIIINADSIPISQQLYSKEISTIKLSALQVNAIPQIAEADLLRSLQNLPGILPLSDFSSALYIRGGTPDQNLYLLDGTDVYNPDHAFGLFSTFNTDAIKQVDISKGGFGADRGGRLSAIIDVTNLDGNREKFEGTAGVSLLAAKTTLQAPMGNFGSLSGSIRRMYIGETIAKINEDIPDYYFYDGSLKAFLDVNEDNNITLSYFNSKDVLDIVFNNNLETDLGFEYNWGNATGSVKWTHVFSPTLYSDFWFTTSYFSSFLKFEGFDADEKNTLRDITFKAVMEHHLSNDFGLKYGFEHKDFNVEYNSAAPGREVLINSKPQHDIAFAQVEWKPTALININGGLRINYFRSEKNYFNISPKLSAKYKLDNKSSIKFSTGVYNQYLHKIPRFLIADIWIASNKELSGSKSNHYIAGYQREIMKDISFEAEVFYKTYDNIYSFDQNFLTKLQPSDFNDQEEPIFTSGSSLLNAGDGHSQGLELMIRKDKGLLSGWLGYSFANTQYTIKEINMGNPFEPRHDRSHTINFVSTLDLDNSLRFLKGKSAYKDSSRWSLGASFVFSTGQPYTEPGSIYWALEAPDDPLREVAFYPTEINQIRLPYYARLDLSLTWTRQYKTWSMAPYLQVFNIGNRSNVWFATYEFEDLAPTFKEQYMFPLLPTIGVNIEF